MQSEVIIAIIGVISSIVTWFLGRKRNKAEVKQIEAEAQASAIKNLHEANDYATDTYKQMVDDVSKQLEESKQRQGQMQTEIVGLRQEISQLRKDYAKSQEQVQSLLDMLQSEKAERQNALMLIDQLRNGGKR